MFLLKRFSIICVLLLSFGPMVWSQTLPTPPAVYVSGGAPNGTQCNSGVTLCTIYVQSGTGFTPVLSMPAANFESLAIGPDNIDLNIDGSGNAAHPFLLYACDTAGKTIIRFDPTAAVPIATQLVASALTITPICGRSSAAGNFYVTDKSGPGVFVFSGIANAPFVGGSSLSSTPAPVTLSPSFPTNMTGRGITQKYVGDLFMVDNFNSEVFRSPYAVPFATKSTFINSSNLNGPVGIATAVTTNLNTTTGLFAANSNFFVANSNSSKTLAVQPPVSVFTFDDTTQAAVPATPCSGLSLPSNNKQVPDYLASAPTANPTNTVINNTIYLVTNSNNAGTLWTWNTAQGTCSLNFAASIGTALSGVAVAPAPVTLTLPVTATMANPTPTTFNFNSNLFQLTATGCTASVTAYPRSLATVNSMINLAGLTSGGDSNAGNANPPYPPSLIPPPLLNPATPLANLGDGGFEIGYVAHWPSCTTVFTDGGFKTGMSNFVDSGRSTNPRAIQCDNSNPTTNTEPQLFPSGVTTCGSPKLVGVYPLGGPVSGDITITKNSFFAMVNENLNTTPGNFCGFQNPLTGNGTTLPTPPPSFSAGTANTVNVKFKLSSSNCKKDFIGDAIALISVARICDTTTSSDPFCGPNGSPVFNAINVQATASSLDQPPLFNSGNNQYSFTLNLPSIFAQAGAGTYSLTVTFFTDNTTNQTTLFKLTP